MSRVIGVQTVEEEVALAAPAGRISAAVAKSIAVLSLMFQFLSSCRAVSYNLSIANRHEGSPEEARKDF
jgi:hypothetical protein